MTFRVAGCSKLLKKRVHSLFVCKQQRGPGIHFNIWGIFLNSFQMPQQQGRPIRRLSCGLRSPRDIALPPLGFAPESQLPDRLAWSSFDAGFLPPQVFQSEYTPRAERRKTEPWQLVSSASSTTTAETVHYAVSSDSSDPPSSDGRPPVTTTAAATNVKSYRHLPNHCATRKKKKNRHSVGRDTNSSVVPIDTNLFPPKRGPVVPPLRLPSIVTVDDLWTSKPKKPPPRPPLSRPVPPGPPPPPPSEACCRGGQHQGAAEEVSRCRVWDLCQPVRCIIDQNEVEIISVPPSKKLTHRPIYRTTATAAAAPSSSSMR